MNYTLIFDNLIVGSQPRTPEDIDQLMLNENVAFILNLQQDKDIEYWEIDFDSIYNLSLLKEPKTRKILKEENKPKLHQIILTPQCLSLFIVLRHTQQATPLFCMQILVIQFIKDRFVD